MQPPISNKTSKSSRFGKKISDIYGGGTGGRTPTSQKMANITARLSAASGNSIMMQAAASNAQS